MERASERPRDLQLLALMVAICAWGAAAPAGAQNDEDLGTVWQEQESGWSGTWTRRAGTPIFDAHWTRGGQRDVRATLHMRIRGRTVTIHREDVTGGGQCAYAGILHPDTVTVRGTYTCTFSAGPHTFSATINRGGIVPTPPPSPDAAVTHGLWGLGVQLGSAEAAALHDESPQFVAQALTYALQLAQATGCVPTGEIEQMLAAVRSTRSTRSLYDAIVAMRIRYGQHVSNGCRCNGSGEQAHQVWANGVHMGIAEISAFRDAGISFLLQGLTAARQTANLASCLPTGEIDQAIVQVARAGTGSAAYPIITAMRQRYATQVTACQCGGQAPPEPTNVCTPGCGHGQVCVNGSCVGTGNVRVTMTWDRPGDVDLHVVTPQGNEIYYARRSQDGGQLDRDDTTGTGPENVFWTENPPRGTYHVCATPYRIREPTNFTITIHRTGRPDQVLRGRREPGRGGNQQCAQGAPDYVTSFSVP